VITLKQLKVYQPAIASAYIKPLQYPEYNQDGLADLFWSKYKHKDTSPASWNKDCEFDNELLNYLPKKLLPYLVTDDLLVLYFHNERTIDKTVIHHDGGNEKEWYAQINLPVYNCTTDTRTTFWEPVGELEELVRYKSTVLQSDAVKAIEFSMTDQPLLFNSTKYHSVELPERKVERASMTVRFKKEYSWLDANDLCKEYFI